MKIREFENLKIEQIQIIMDLAEKLIGEKRDKFHGGLYHKTQVNLAYNSNRIEGSKLTEEQTRYIFETRTIGFKDQEAVPVDDIIETSNHFVAFDMMLETLEEELSGSIIKKFHSILKAGTSDSHKTWFGGGGTVNDIVPLLSGGGSVYYSTVDRINFATDTTMVTAKGPLTGSKNYLAAI